VRIDGDRPALLVDADRAGPERGEIRAAAVSSSPSASLTVKSSPSWLIRSARDPVCTLMPSRPKTSAISAPDSGSSSGSSWPSASTTVTAVPNRANTCASSVPIAPPPSTISDSGTCSVSIA
jgi:hypothetical protein